MPKPRFDPEEALTGPLYVVALILVAMPVVDIALSVGAPQIGSVQWRFATVGLLSGFTLTPILGFALALVVAAVAKHAIIERLIVVASLATGVLLLILTAGFVLDALQLRNSIPSEGQRAFKSAWVRAVLKHLMAVVGFWYLGWRGRLMIPATLSQKPTKGVQIVAK